MDLLSEIASMFSFKREFSALETGQQFVYKCRTWRKVATDVAEPDQGQPEIFAGHVPVIPM